MKKDNSFPQLIDIGEVAQILGVSVDTLRRWDKVGKLQSIRLATNSKRRYKLKDVEHFIDKEHRND